MAGTTDTFPNTFPKLAMETVSAILNPLSACNRTMSTNEETLAQIKLTNLEIVGDHCSLYSRERCRTTTK
jgi:hypothetical protein